MEMINYSKEYYEIIEKVSSLLGKPINTDSIEVIYRGMPHIPKGLKPGMMGVYTFIYKDTFLKIGKAGPNSSARFLSQHYNPHSAMSTLAASILADTEMNNLGITESSVGEWIKNNCIRIDILMHADLGIFALELVEAILHYKYNPKYEGFSSQR
ncbi:MAG: hypothetical protein AB9835_01740 [Eubacteriales bacterium]